MEREQFSAKLPLHVTWRIVKDVASLRKERVLELVRQTLAAHANRADFRVVEFNVLGHHAAERGQALAKHWVDPYSSAPWFDGWKEPIRSEADWLVRLRKRARPTATPQTWLLATGWRRHGLLAFDEVNGGAGMGSSTARVLSRPPQAW